MEKIKGGYLEIGDYTKYFGFILLRGRKNWIKVYVN